MVSSELLIRMERRTLFLSLVLAVLVIALGVVGVFVLRRRSILQTPGIIARPGSTRSLPTDTKPYASLKKVESWKPGDPVPTTSPQTVILQPSTETATSSP